jgi:hypothetical protein
MAEASFLTEKVRIDNAITKLDLDAARNGANAAYVI